MRSRRSRTFGIKENWFKLIRKRFKRTLRILPKLRTDQIASLLIIIGIILLVFTPFYKQVINKQIADVVQTEPIQADLTKFNQPFSEEELPQRLIIPSLSIDLTVTPAKVVKGYWEISETTASFGLGSVPPGEIGNTVIFAHARNGLFGDLPKVKNEDLIYVLTKNGWFVYKVSEIKVVWPNQVEVIAPTSDETLTLYTCSGFADTKRLIVVGKRIL